MATIYDKMTAIANAIRSKTGYSGKLTLDQMATQINSIETQDTLIERKVTKIVNSNVSYVASYAFWGYGALQEVSLPNVTTVYSYAFSGCTSLISVSLPKVVSINNSFESAVGNKIQYAYLPKCTNYFPVGNSMISLTLGTSICDNITYKGALKYVNFPNATTIEGECFYNARSLISASFPNVTSVGTNAFNQCILLSNIYLPKANYIGDSSFQSCSKLAQLSISASYIGNMAFFSCTNLSKLTLTYPSVCRLGNYPTGIFIGTKIYSGTGSIYVPASLLASYKNDYNWSYFSSRIFSM